MEHIMAQPKDKPDPAASGRSILHEADVGSGERTPGQEETDELIREIPPRGQGDRQDTGAGGRKEKS
jgi:hypothetical protein